MPQTFSLLTTSYFDLDPGAATGFMRVDPSAYFHFQSHLCQWGFTLRPGKGVQDWRETCYLRAACEGGVMIRRQRLGI